MNPLRELEPGLIPSGDRVRTRTLGMLSLFASVGTLLCCALPSLLVFLGFGAAVATLVSNVPFLVVLSHHKGWMFAAAGMLIGAGFAYRRWLAPRLMARRLACAPGDPRCRTLDRMSGALLWLPPAFFLARGGLPDGLPPPLAM